MALSFCSVVPTALTFISCPYPALKGWAKLFRPAKRDWGQRRASRLEAGQHEPAGRNRHGPGRQSWVRFIKSDESGRTAHKLPHHLRLAAASAAKFEMSSLKGLGSFRTLTQGSTTPTRALRLCSGQASAARVGGPGSALGYDYAALRALVFRCSRLEFALLQLVRLVIPSQLAKERSQVLPSREGIRMVPPQRLLEDGQRPLHQRLGLAQPVRVPQRQG